MVTCGCVIVRCVQYVWVYELWGVCLIYHCCVRCVIYSATVISIQVPFHLVYLLKPSPLDTWAFSAQHAASLGPLISLDRQQELNLLVELIINTL